MATVEPNFKEVVTKVKDGVVLTLNREETEYLIKLLGNQAVGGASYAIYNALTAR